MQHALAIEEGDDQLHLDGLVDERELTSFCAGLVVVDKQSSLIDLVHSTAQEFFQQRKQKLFPLAHEVIGTTCITYLCTKDFRESGACLSREEFFNRRGHYQLLDYAAFSWGYHVWMTESEKLFDLAHFLLHHEMARAAATQALFLSHAGKTARWTESDRLKHGLDEIPYCIVDGLRSSMMFHEAICLAALYGLLSFSKIPAQNHADEEETDSSTTRALHWPLLGEQDATAKFPLEQGTDANAEVVARENRLRI